MAAPKTFLELVNTAIAESKVQLDPLTSVNFATPPRTVMYNNFKRWVNSAYNELYIDRPEWHFRKERASFNLYPRLHLGDVLTAVGLVGKTLEGQSSGVQFTVLAIYTFEDVEGDTDLEYTVDVEFVNGSDPANLIFREVFEDIAVPGIAFAYLKGFGRYDFRSNISTLSEIDINTVRIYQFPEDAVLEPDWYNAQGKLLQPILWEDWSSLYNIYPWSGQTPNYITEAPDGTYEIYPRPDTGMLISFDYVRNITDMVEYDDLPEGIPADYHPYLMWKAVEEYADFDNNGRLFLRAKKHTDKYYYYLDRDEKQDPRFESSRFNF